MQLSNKIIFLILPILIITNNAYTQTTEPIIDTETYQIGVMVQAVQGALQQRDEQALQTISLYGTDSRYYSMIRGWLFQELVGVESQLHASKSEHNAVVFQTQSNFLKKAIVLIDLE